MSSFHLENNIVSSKMREEMYVKHLREVERINNREADGLRKDIKQYRSISELHHQNKERALKWKISEHERELRNRNIKIFRKIEALGNSNTMKSSRTHGGEQKSPMGGHKESLHYRYRKRQQEHI